jgi:hypothetical protein
MLSTRVIAGDVDGGRTVPSGGVDPARGSERKGEQG